MTAPDPADLRLVAALADLGRAGVLDVAARAGLHPEEAAVRLLRLGGSGLRLVVGVEGDVPALRSWVTQQQAPPAPPSWTAPPTGWGVPPTSGWVRPDQASAAAAPAQPAGVGTRLAATGAQGHPVWLTVVEVVDTADALLAAAGQAPAPGTRATVVSTEATAGPAGYPIEPDTGLVLVLGDGREVTRSTAALTTRPPYRGGLGAGETVAGHTVFTVEAQAAVVAVRWRAQPGGPALEWRL